WTRWSAKFTKTTRGRASEAPASGTTVQLAPPYSCTRERALKGAGRTVTGSAAADAPSGAWGSDRATGPGVRTIAWRPPSVAIPSVHHTSSPTGGTRLGSPRLVGAGSALRGRV